MPSLNIWGFLFCSRKVFGFYFVSNNKVTYYYYCTYLQHIIIINYWEKKTNKKFSDPKHRCQSTNKINNLQMLWLRSVKLILFGFTWYRCLWEWHCSNANQSWNRQSILCCKWSREVWHSDGSQLLWWIWKTSRINIDIWWHLLR